MNTRIHGNFSEAFEDLILHEGGYVNHPDDPGGETKFGISKRRYPSLNIADLTLYQARNIYRKDYWLRYRINQVADLKIASKMLSLLVTMPPQNWGLICQSALRATGTTVVLDGVVGSKTIQAINTTDPDLLLVALRSEAAGYYRSLQNHAFTKGWLSRAYA